VGLVDEGSGPVVVALHGLPGSVRDFRWLAPALTDTHRVIRVELPGFGRSPVGGTGYDLNARGAFVAGLIEELGLEEVVVLGHSMGGPVAVSAAVQSERIRAVALLASVGPDVHRAIRRQPGVRAACYTLHSSLVARLGMPLLKRSFASMGFRNVSESDILQACFVLSRFRFRTHRANLAALRKPTLVAWAQDDALVEEAISDKLYWAAPAGPRVRFATGGHNIQATRATELAEALKAWV